MKEQSKKYRIWRDKESEKAQVKILYLNLKKKWFDMILEGKKTEEYRSCTVYWNNRLFNPDTSTKHYDFVCFRNGYSPLADEMVFEYDGVRMDMPFSEWTDEPDIACFVISLGDAVYTNVE
jgi:ATP-dependent Lon protease